MPQGIVLFGHGSRNAEWAQPFHAIAAAVQQMRPGVPVALGFLELMQPSLPEAIASLVDQGANEIAVVPVFISAGSHVREDLPQLLAEAMAAHPGITVRAAPSLGEAPEIIAAMAAYAVTAAGA